MAIVLELIMVDEGYDIAQVCFNGHVTNSSAKRISEHNQEYCNRCGQKTITNCPSCNNEIRGDYWGGGFSTAEFIAPSYCQKCGKPFPWTENKIKSVIEYSKEFGGLDSNEADELEKSINDLVSDTPKTQLGASRFKRIMTKVGAESASAIKEIIVDIVSESAKKIIWGK
jgi:hypothetical protein